MAQPEQKLDFSPAASHKVLFRHTTRDTRGGLLEMEVYLSSRSRGEPLHYHPVQEERIYVVQGKLTCLCEGKKYTLQAGESLVIEPGEVHSFRNESREPVYFLNELRPALDFEYFVEELEACVKKSGSQKLYSVSGLMHFMVVFHRYKKEMQLAGKFNRNLGGILAWVGQRLGYGR